MTVPHRPWSKGLTHLTPEAMTPHRAVWADLAARALEPSIFNDPAFMVPAALHLSGRRPPLFLTAWDPHDASRLTGLCCVAPPVPGLPLSAWLHPQATAAFPLLDAAQAEEALDDLLAQTAGRLRPAGLLVQGLPADGATMGLIAGRPRWAMALCESRSRAVVRDAPTKLAGKAGKEFRRQARKLAQEGRVAVTEAATSAACDAFLHLEAQGWKGHGATALASDPRRARFARDMLASLLEQDRCRIHGLTLDDRPIALGLMLRAGPHAFFWKTAFDEAYARFSPGAHLAEAIGQTQAREPGVAFTDSCAVPGHSMIDRLWPGRMTVVDALLVPTPELSRLQRLGLRAERARRGARRWAKRLMAAAGRGSRHIPDRAKP